MSLVCVPLSVLMPFLDTLFFFFLCRYRRGTVAQRCYDPECSNFQSDPMDIPLEVLPRVSQRTSMLDTRIMDSEFGTAFYVCRHVSATHEKSMQVLSTTTI